jgi:hypothetical protein
MKGYYTNQYFTYPLRDRRLNEKIRYLCNMPTEEMITERHFIKLVTRLIEEAYKTTPSKLGI